MRLYQLEYLIAVSRSGSISKAADELRVSRPAVSKALGELESEYRIKLFERTNSGITLTEAGCTFYERCTEIHKQLGSLQNEMNTLRERAAKKDIRRLRISLSPAMGYAVFPDFCARFLTKYPDVVFEPMELTYKQACLMLEDGSIDASFCISVDADDNKFSSVAITEMELCFCCNTQHRLAEREFVTIDDILDEQFIQLEGNFKPRAGGMEKRFAGIGRVPNTRFRTSQISMVHHMVANGLCCCSQLRDVMTGIPGIAAIPFENSIIYPGLIEWNDTVRHNSAFADLIEFAKTYWHGPAHKTCKKEK